jgi:hypothetical protein
MDPREALDLQRRLEYLKSYNSSDPEIKELELLLSRRSFASTQQIQPTRYTRKTPAAWFAAEEILEEETFDVVVKKIEKSKRPPFRRSYPANITADNAYQLLKTYNEMLALLNRPPSELIPLTSFPSRFVDVVEDYRVLFSIDAEGDVEFHIRPLPQESVFTLLTDQDVPKPKFEGVSPVYTNGPSERLEYTKQLKVVILTKSEQMSLLTTKIVRTDRYPDVVFDGTPQTITLPFVGGVWKQGGNPIGRGNSIQIESISNPDRRDLDLIYDTPAGNPVNVKIIYHLPCKRCGQRYKRSENRHGACVWHPKHGQRWHEEYEAQLQTLTKFAAEKGVSVDTLTLGDLIKKYANEALLTNIRQKLQYIEQKFEAFEHLAAISKEKVKRITAIVSKYADDSKTPYELNRLLKRLFTIETVEQINNPAYFDFSDVALHPQSDDQRNPNKHYGFYNGTWLCCGQKASNGCLTGWHSSTNDEPTFTHIAFHDAPIQCTEYINDPNTSSEVFYRAVDTYRRGDKIGTIQLEMLQNRIHGAQLRIRFTKKDSTRDFEMRTNVLTGVEFTGEKLQALLDSEMENNSTLQKIWIRDRSDALSFPNGTNQRYITDTNYIDRLIAVVELVNDSKNNDSTVAKTNLENKLRKIFPTATLKVALTPEQQRIKTEIDTILQKLESNVKQLEKNKVTLQTFKTSWDTIIGKLERKVWGDPELKIAGSVDLPDVALIKNQLTPIDENWVLAFKKFKSNQDYTDANKTMLENLLKNNPISKLDLSDIEKTLRETKDRLNTYLQSRDTLYATLEKTLEIIVDKLNPTYKLMKSKYDKLSLDIKKKINAWDAQKNNAARILKRALASKKSSLFDVIKNRYSEYYNLLTEIRSQYATKRNMVVTPNLIQNFPNTFNLTSDKMKELYTLVELTNEDEIQEVLAAYKPWKDEFGKLLILYDTDDAVKNEISGYINELSESTVRKAFENVADPEKTKMELVNSKFWIKTINGLYVKLLDYKLDELNKKATNLETIAVDTSLFNNTDYANVRNQYTAADTQLSDLESQSDIIQYSDRFFEPLETAIDEYQKKLETSIDKVYTEFEAFRDGLNLLDTTYTSSLPKPKVDLTTPGNTIDAYNAVKKKLDNMPTEKTEIEQRIESIKNDIDENFTTIDEILKTKSEDFKNAIDLVKKDYLTKVSVQELTAFLKYVNDIQQTLLANQPLEMSEMEQKRQAFRNEVYQPITGGTEENLLFEEMQTRVIERIQAHPVLTKIREFITDLKLGDIKNADLDNTKEQHLIIGALKDLGNPKTGAELLLYHFVRPGKIEYKEGKYGHAHLFELAVNNFSWEAAIEEQKDQFALRFLSVVENIGFLLKPLQTAVDALKPDEGFLSKKRTKSGTGEQKAPGSVGFTEFDVVYDKDTVYRTGDKSSQCLTQLNKHRKLKYNIVIANTRKSGESIENYVKPTFFITYGLSSEDLNAVRTRVREHPNTFVVNVVYSGGYRINDSGWPASQLEKYENSIDFNVKFIKTGTLVSNEGGIDKFKQWLNDQSFKFIENSASPVINFNVQNTGASGKVTTKNDIIDVPYAQTKGGFVGKVNWSNYEIVSDEIPALRTAILELLAKQYAPKQSAPPVTKPPETSTTEPGAEETTTTEEPLKKGTEEKKSERPPTREPLIPTIKYRGFENLKAGMEDPKNQARAKSTVWHIWNQFKYKSLSDVKYAKASIRQRPFDYQPLKIQNENFTQKYTEWVLEKYYTWVLMLYSLADSEISRKLDFLSELQTECAKKYTEHISLKAFARIEENFVELFESDRELRLVNEKKQTFNDYIASKEKEVIITIKFNKITPENSYIRVPFWVWQPNLFYAYGVLSDAIEESGCTIESDFWTFSKIITESDESAFEEIIKYKDAEYLKIEEKFRQLISSKTQNTEVLPYLDTLAVSGSNQYISVANKLPLNLQWQTNVLLPFLREHNMNSFRESENINPKSKRLIYKLTKSNTVLGYSVMTNNRRGFVPTETPQTEIDEIVAKENGRLLFFQMYLDTFLFVSKPHLLWLTPKKKYTIGTYSNGYQVYQSVPEKLITAYTSWGFNRTFDLTAKAGYLLQDHEHLFKISDETGAKYGLLHKNPPGTELEYDILHIFSFPLDLTTPSTLALCRLFGANIDKIGKLSEAKPDTPLKAGDYVAKKSLSVDVGIKDIFSDVFSANITPTFYAGKKVEIEMKIGSTDNDVQTAFETLVASALNISSYERNKKIEKRFVLKCDGVFKETRFHDIVAIPEAYVPKWLKDVAPKNYETTISKARNDFINQFATSSNIERYAKLLLQYIPPKITFAEEVVDVGMQAALDFLRNLT